MLQNNRRISDNEGPPRFSVPFPVVTSFKGRVRKTGGSLLVVDTEIGELHLHVNESTRLCGLGVSPGDCEIVSLGADSRPGGELGGQDIVGTLIAYPAGSTGPPYLLCTDLCHWGQRADRPAYLSPAFWRETLIEQAAWWCHHAVDRECGGYVTNLRCDGTVPAGPDGADKWGYVVSRTLYTFCSAFAVSGEYGWLEAAAHGARFLRDRVAYLHEDRLLFHTRLTRNGVPHADHPDVINIFTQVYALTGLVAYYEITRCPETVAVINASLRSLAELFRDREFLGFYDAIYRDSLAVEAGVTDSKSFNSVVDPLSAALYHLDNVGFSTAHLPLRATIRELCGLILDHFVDPDCPFIRELFQRDWRYAPPNWHNPYNTEFTAGNVGANMKTVWVLLRGWDLLTDSQRARAGDAIDHILRSIVDVGAWDAFRGGWFDVMQRESPPRSPVQHLWHANKVWWQQEEGILACLLSHLLRRDADHLRMAREGIQFYLAYFVDRDCRGVFDTVSSSGLPVNRRKGSWLKGGYHEAELSRFLHIYLSALGGDSVTLYYRPHSSATLPEPGSVPARIPGLTWDPVEREHLAGGTIRMRYEPRASRHSSSGELP